MWRPGRLLRAASLALLSATAAFGLVVAAAGLLASTPTGAGWVAGALTGALDGVVAGRFTLGGLEVRPGGGLELRDLELADPAGHRVIRVGRLRARLELGGLARRLAGVELELDQPEVLLEPNGRGGVTIADAFAAPGPAAAGVDPWRGWTIRVTRLRIRGGMVTWRGAGERTWLKASALELEGTGRLGPAGVVAGLELKGQVEAPLQGPLSIDLAARVAERRLTVARLELGAAASRLEAIGEWDWGTGAFRAAASRVALAARDLEALAGRRTAAADLAGRLFAASDGKRLTAAVELEAPAAGRGGGRAAMAFRLGPGSPAELGFDVHLVELDPARLLSRAPRGRLSATGRGALAWPMPGPGDGRRGHLSLDRLELTLPGLQLDGDLRWRQAGAMGGALRLAISDLATAGPAVAALLGVTLPALSGQGQASLALGGTAEAPEATLAVRLPGGRVAGASLADARAELTLAGSSLRLTAGAALGALDGALVSADAAATLSLDWRSAQLSRLEVVLAGGTWTLAGPATLELALPGVDRAVLGSGAQRLTLSGGIRPDGEADARLEVSRIELSRLPGALLPGSLGLQGRADGSLHLAGPARRRTLEATVAVAEGALAGLTGLELQASLRWRRPAGRALLEATLHRTGGGTLALAAELPWPDPGAAPSAPVTGRLDLDGWPLLPLLRAGGSRLDADGLVAGTLTLAGSAGAPRLTARAELTGGRWSDLGPLQLTATAAATGRTLRAGAALALQATGLARATVELGFDTGGLLTDPGRSWRQLTTAAWTAHLELPGAELTALAGKAGLPAGLAGRLRGRVDLGGSPSAPRGTAALDASGLGFRGRPIGDLKGTLETAGGALRLELALAPVEGGSLRLDGRLGAVPGLGTTAGALAEAPLQLSVTGRALDLGFLPPLLPRLLLAASGRLETALTVTGSPAAPLLAGSMSLAGAKVTLAGLGTFTDLGFEATLDQSVARLERLRVSRGRGRLAGDLTVRGIGGAEARLAGTLAATDLGIARANMEVATIDARAALGGRYRQRRLELEAIVERGGSIRLPRKAPRALQPLEVRPDIVIGEAAPEPGAASPSQAAPPPDLAVSVRVRAEAILVKSDQPRLHVELWTDSTWEATASPLRVAGAIDASRGSVEPIAGRLFQVGRSHVGFTGGPLDDAQLELTADHQAPGVKVHATVTGTLGAPRLQLTSEPPLDEAVLAMLIVTGRTELTAGGTQGPAFTAQDAGMAAAMAVANRVFESKLGEKMPFDTLTLDAGAVTAGKQLTDRIFVGYVRRFDARPDKGENVDEVRVQYHITPRWTLESRYGNAGAGGGSLIWQKDY